MDKKEIKRNREMDAARERRRLRRKRVVRMEKSIVALVLVSLIVGCSVLAYNLIPSVKLNKQLKEANACIEEERFSEAIAYCEEALMIDSSSVKAYTAMAGAYLTQEDPASAEKVLYQGWGVTQDESLLQYYCTVLLNEAVAEINAQNCTFGTWNKCITVLEDNPTNTDVYALLDVCYERLWMEDAGLTDVFCDTEDETDEEYQEYQNLMDRMIRVYEFTPCEELKAQILKFAVPKSEQVWMDANKMQAYMDFLVRVQQIGEDESIAEIVVCLQKAIEMQTFFGEAFSIFESGDFAPIKDFMQKEEYIAIRDQFMEDTMEYWDGKTYIPVTREKVKLIKTEEGWKFAFADFDEYPETSGLIRIWSAIQKDDGVQRLCISYEPALIQGEYYPHTTYEFIYLYSNVRINGVDVPRMNYRFETRVATPEETITTVIGDWGGEHEFDMEF